MWPLTHPAQNTGAGDFCRRKPTCSLRCIVLMLKRRAPTRTPHGERREGGIDCVGWQASRSGVAGGALVALRVRNNLIVHSHRDRD